MLGISLERARVTFMGLYVDLANAIGKSRRPCMALNKCSKAVERLKNRMDETVCGENPEVSDYDATRVYYGLTVEAFDAEWGPIKAFVTVKGQS